MIIFQFIDKFGQIDRSHHTIFYDLELGLDSQAYQELFSLNQSHFNSSRDVKMTPFINLFKIRGHIGWGFGVKEVMK